MYQAIKKFFESSQVTRQVYEKFIDTGEVPEKVIKTLATKIIAQQEMNDREKAVFFTKTGEINEMIIKLKK